MRRAGQVLTGVCCVAVLVAGPPLALLRLVGPSLPWPPGVDDPDGTAVVHQAVIAAAALTGWLIWAAILAALAARIVRGLARLLRLLPHLRLPGPLQSLSAAVLGTVAVTTAASSAAPAAAHATATTSDPWLSPAYPLTSGNSTPDRVSGHQHTSAVPSTALDMHRTASPPQLLVYPVAQGDWLGYIAERFLGDFNRYPDIRDLNPDLIPDRSGPHGPDHIQPRWRLKLPANAYDRGPRKHATGHLVAPPSTPTNPGSGADDPAGNPPPPPPPHTPAPTTPTPTTPTRAAPAPSAPTSSPAPIGGRPAAPSRSTTASAAPDPSEAPTAFATYTPGPSADASGTVASSTPSRSSLAPAPAGTRQAPPKDRRGIGVHLPGGWIPIPLAVALVAAAAMVWLRRRHRYIPGQPAGPVLSDPDLQPLPPAVTVLRRGVRRYAPDLLPPITGPEPASGHETAEATRLPATQPPARDAATLEELPPIGPSGPDLAGLGSPLPAGGLGLVGDGAYAAARAMLVATLSSGSPGDPDARGQVVIPVDALTTLLGVDAVNLTPTPRLTVTANLGEALTRLDELVIERRRTLHDEDADDLESMRAADPMHPPMPPVLLLAEVPEPPSRARLTTTLHLGAPLQINAVLLGDWSRGDTLDVDTEGYTDTEDSDRLAVLDTTTTLHLLQILSEAHTGQHSAAPVPEPAVPATIDEADPTRAGHDVQAELDLPDLDLPELDAPKREPQTRADTAQADAPARVPRPDPGDAASAPAVARARVDVRVLGRPALLTVGPPKQELRRRALELLIYLAVHRRGANLPDIKEAFWPDASNRRAGERLQTEVGDLRARVRDAYRAANPDTETDEQLQPVVNTGGRYHLNPDLVDIDWWTVQDALAAATTDTAHRVEHLRRAVDAFGGPLAEGCGYDWLPDVAEHVRRQGIIAYTQLATLVADTDADTDADIDTAEAARLFDRAAALEPINEELARAAMRAQARLGDADAVRAALHRIRTALDEIDVEPDEATTTLAADLLGQITSAGPEPRPPQEPPPR